MPFAATCTDPEIIILNEVSQTENQISYDISYMWDLIEMIQKNLFTKQKQTDFAIKHSCQRGNLGRQIRRSELTYIH